MTCAENRDLRTCLPNIKIIFHGVYIPEVGQRTNSRFRTTLAQLVARGQARLEQGNLRKGHGPAPPLPWEALILKVSEIKKPSSLEFDLSRAS